MKFYQFTEENDWEGEAWNFYIPADGNKDAIALLSKAIEEEEDYIIRDEMVDEVAVDILLEQDNEIGYMAKHNKLEGKLSMEKIQAAMDDKEDEYAVHGILYKGGISDLMEK